MALSSDRLLRPALHFIAFAVAFGMAAWVRFGPLEGLFPFRAEPPAPLYFQYALLFALLAVAVLVIQGEYDAVPVRMSASRFVTRSTLAAVWSLALLILFAFFTKPVPPSRVVVAFTVIWSVVLMGLVGIYERRKVRQAPGVFFVIAARDRVTELEALMQRARPNAFVVTVETDEQDPEALLNMLRARWEDARPACAICALNGPSRLQHGLLALTLRYNIPVKFVPSEEGFLLRRLSLEEFEGIPFLSPRPLHTSFANQAVKRALDILLATALLVLTFPLWLVLIIAIPLESAGAPFYLHRRLGKGGKPFYIYKFRTMRKGADREFSENVEIMEQFSERFKLKRDPRVTRLGAILRKLSLDELPQLINVLKGEMSFIGPRPIVPEEIPKYGDWADLLFAVKPGITGLWQVSGRTDLTYEKRVQLDIYYILNWSLWLDIYILLLTPSAVLSGQGAYTL